MIRTFNILITGIILISFIGCKEQPNENVARFKGQPVIKDTAAYYDSLLNSIESLQNSLIISPANVSLQKKLVSNSFDSFSGSFRLVGKGVTNKEHPDAAQKAGRSMAAQFTGKRWAFYIKSWYGGDSIPFGRQINGSVMYSRTLLQKELGDTLFMLLDIPMGSIVVY